MTEQDRADDDWTEYGRAGDPGPQEHFRPEDWVSPLYCPQMPTMTVAEINEWMSRVWNRK